MWGMVLLDALVEFRGMSCFAFVILHEMDDGCPERPPGCTRLFIGMRGRYDDGLLGMGDWLMPSEGTRGHDEFIFVIAISCYHDWEYL